MIVQILFFILVFFAYYLGNDFGISLYYYFDRGVFQSSIGDLWTSPLQEIFAGTLASFFTVLITVVFDKIIKIKVINYYIVSIVIIYFMQFIANWAETAKFQISELTHILLVVFINIEFVAFCVPSFILLTIFLFLKQDKR